jgi:hypothetical protein
MLLSRRHGLCLHSTSMEQHEHDKAPHLEGREVDLEDFIAGRHADSRTEPTPEGGQAGIAQGNTAAQGHTAGLTGEVPADGETFASTDQFSTSGQVSRTELARKELHDQT